MGRPQVWPTKLSAPAEFLELYELIGRLQNHPGWEACHIFRGAHVRGLPVIKVDGAVTPLAAFIASHLALPHATRQCTSPGCCNPLHYLPDPGMRWTAKELVVTPGKSELLELTQYYADLHRIRSDDMSFNTLRPLIPVEDITDEQLREIL